MQIFGLPSHIIRNGRAASRDGAERWRPGSPARRRQTPWASNGPRSTAGRRSPNPKTVGRIARAVGDGRASWRGRSKTCATTIPYGASTRSPCCCAGKASPARFRQSAAFSPSSRRPGSRRSRFHPAPQAGRKAYRHSGRQRQRVQIGLRGRMPGARPRTLRPAAQTPRSQTA